MNQFLVIVFLSFLPFLKSDYSVSVNIDSGNSKVSILIRDGTVQTSSDTITCSNSNNNDNVISSSSYPPFLTSESSPSSSLFFPISSSTSSLKNNNNPTSFSISPLTDTSLCVTIGDSSLDINGIWPTLILSPCVPFNPNQQWNITYVEQQQIIIESAPSMLVWNLWGGCPPPNNGDGKPLALYTLLSPPSENELFSYSTSNSLLNVCGGCLQMTTIQPNSQILYQSNCVSSTRLNQFVMY